MQRGTPGGLLCRMLLLSILVFSASQVSARQDLETLIAEARARHAEAVLQIKLEEKLEQELTQSVEEVVEEVVEGVVEETVEELVNEVVEGEVEVKLVEAVEGDVETRVSESVSDVVEERIAENLQESVEELISATVEQSIEEEIAATVAADIEEDIAANLEETLDQVTEAYAEQNIEQSVEDSILDSVIDSIIETTEEDLDARINQPGRHLSKQEWLVMAEESAFEVLAEKGYVFDRVTHLEGLGLQLAEVSAPASFDISEVRAGILDVVGSDFAHVDVNHFYTAGVPTPSSATGYSPRDAMSFPPDLGELSLRLGMIDTAVDDRHPAFANTHMQTRHFGAHSDRSPSLHGTAIASMLSADSEQYSGIAPGSRLFAASIFEIDAERGEVASTASLVKALDWLTREQVEVVNISLAGPPNRLLEAVLVRVSQKGIPVLAAAGNAGPASEPLYPAAYETVVAITAVEPDGRVFRLANRGDHLDLSAPGVNILHAQAGGGYQASSGTSFAVPFASVAVARLLAQHPQSDALSQLYRSATDLGPPGKDMIYGHGLLNPQVSRQYANYQR